MSNIPLPPPTADLAVEIQGVWILESRVDMDAEGRIAPDPFMGKAPLAILCFGKNHFAAQFMKRDRSGSEIQTKRAQSKNNSVGVNGYDAYFGTYTVEEAAGTVTTRIEGSIAPDNIGNEYVREVRAFDDTLIIRLKTTAVDGTEVTRTNTFRREH